MFCKLNFANSLELFDKIQSIKSIKNEVTNVSQNPKSVNIDQTIINL